MPQIVEYVNREGITPTDRGTEARVQEGRRIGASFNQVAENLRDFGNRVGQQIGSAVRDAGNAAVQYAEHREISQGVATYAQLQNTLTNQWNSIASNADPNDPSVRQKFLDETLTPALQKWGETFQTEGGQKFAQARTAALLDHMGEKTAADMSSMAGRALENNIHTLGVASSNTVWNDPSSVDHVLSQIDGSVDALVGSSPNLKGPEAAKARMLAEQLKEQVVKSWAAGAIAKSANPEQTAAQIPADPRYSKYITGAEAQILAGNARQQTRARNYDFETNRRREREIAQDVSNEKTNQYIIDVRSQDPKLANDPTAKKILNDPELTKTDKNNLLNLIDRQLKPETDARISAQTFTSLMRDLGDPNSDAAKLQQRAWDAYTKKEPGQPGSLSYADLDRFRKEIEGRKTPEGMALQQDRNEFFKKYAPTIDAGMQLGEHSSAGAQAMYFAQKDAKRQEQVLRSKGIDPHELYDPRSQYFFGSPQNLEKYRPKGSLQEVIKDQAVRKPPPFVPLAKSPPADEKPTTFEDRFNAAFPSGSPQERANKATGVNPTRVRQGGHIFERQSDGTMKDMGTE